jgi:hypothetical protein
MGTPSLTYVQGENNENLCAIYRQFDGYPEDSGMGGELYRILFPMKIVEGISPGDSDKIGKIANGMDCLAAQIVSRLKKRVGNVYLVPPNAGESYVESAEIFGVEFLYIIFPPVDNGEVSIQILGRDSLTEFTTLYRGPVSGMPDKIPEISKMEIPASAEA